MKNSRVAVKYKLGSTVYSGLQGAPRFERKKQLYYKMYADFRQHFLRKNVCLTI
jgi:hypothetical protein